MEFGELYKQLLQEAIDRNKIIDAIDKKRVLTIYYKADRDENEVTGWRKIEPFCCGINHYGNPVLRAWQVSGVSNSYPPGKAHDPLTGVPGWRMFRMDKILSMAVGWDKFTQPRPKYNPNDKDMEVIYKAADFGGGQPPKQQTGTPVAPTTPAAPTVKQQPVAPAPAPVVPQPKPQTVLPKITHHQKVKTNQNMLDKLTDKFKRLINYRPK